VLKIYNNIQNFFCTHKSAGAKFFYLKLWQQVHVKGVFDMKFHDVHYPHYIVRKGQRVHLRYLRISIFYNAAAIHL